MIYGGSGSSYVDKIYKYNTDGGQWDEVPTTMSEAKWMMTAIKVKNSIFKTNCTSGKIPLYQRFCIATTNLEVPV